MAVAREVPHFTALEAFSFVAHPSGFVHGGSGQLDLDNAAHEISLV